jgi:hypothetical protein
VLTLFELQQYSWLKGSFAPAKITDGMPAFGRQLTDAPIFRSRPPGDSRERLLCGVRNRRYSAAEAAPMRAYFAATIPGGFQVPLPAGKIEGGVSLGQYKRITK